MSKAFTKENDSADEDDDLPASALPAGAKNYMTPGGHARLLKEMDDLLGRERPELVKIVQWAAGNGDRSENGDYLYGKRRLREIDRRIRYLKRQLDNAEVIDPILRRDSDNSDQAFFGATVTYSDRDGHETTLSIVGVDEADLHRGYVSWMSPVARALTKARAGDSVQLRTPKGVEELDVLDVQYLPLATDIAAGLRLPDTTAASPVVRSNAPRAQR